MNPCNSESYCEGGFCFIRKTGKDLLLAHFINNMGITGHPHRHLLHHLAQICSRRGLFRSHRHRQLQGFNIKPPIPAREAKIIHLQVLQSALSVSNV